MQECFAAEFLAEDAYLEHLEWLMRYTVASSFRHALSMMPDG